MTEAADSSATVHVSLPVQAPDHPAKVEPAAAVAVSVTDVPVGKLAEHVDPQLIPEGLLVTVPVPAPANATVSCAGGTVAVLNVAETEVSPERLILHDAVPLQAPPHPEKVMPDAAVAVSEMLVPAG
ncbi:hypothetical protein MOP44_21095 [Occallatibacter riparius]|uniref:Uncharacterized protein n=1 Tax=Occallatibacter riparius TaxID=1002689 RepID=A0A9J7BQ37_9BACT|nr:hypothetical protein [Occallatibacter riparius]UWZ83054.1 hypothetical protein MOP44_21095 [Occallatibacter riparius]